MCQNTHEEPRCGGLNICDCTWRKNLFPRNSTIWLHCTKNSWNFEFVKPLWHVCPQLPCNLAHLIHGQIPMYGIAIS